MKKTVIGIDVGGTGIQIGVVDEEGRILEKGSIVTRIDLPFSEQIAQMAACAKDTLARSGHKLEEVVSIGAGVPGIAQRDTGMVVFCTNMNRVHVPFREEFQKHIDRPYSSTTTPRWLPWQRVSQASAPEPPPLFS